LLLEFNELTLLINLLLMLLFHLLLCFLVITAQLSLSEALLERVLRTIIF
jgi:hypothetical protein